MSGERRSGADFRPRPVQVRPKAASKPSRDQFFTSRVQNGEFLLAATAVAPASPADAGESHRIIVPRSPPVAVDALGSPSADCVPVLTANKLRKRPGTHRAQIPASRAPQGATGRGNPGPGALYPAVSTLQVQTGHLNRLDGPAAARHSGRTPEWPWNRSQTSLHERWPVQERIWSAGLSRSGLWAELHSGRLRITHRMRQPPSFAAWSDRRSHHGLFHDAKSS